MENEDTEQDLLPANELQAAQIREIALNGVETLQQTARNMQDSAAALGRWILASLLAINSGAAVAVLSASDVVIGPLGPPLVCFSIGAALALATGINGLVTGIRVGPVIATSIELLRLSVFESAIHASTKRQVKTVLPILRQQLIISAGLAAGSLGAFTAGVAFAVS